MELLAICFIIYTMKARVTYGINWVCIYRIKSLANGVTNLSLVTDYLNMGNLDVHVAVTLDITILANIKPNFIYLFTVRKSKSLRHSLSKSMNKW